MGDVALHAQPEGQMSDPSLQNFSSMGIFAAALRSSVTTVTQGRDEVRVNSVLGAFRFRSVSRKCRVTAFLD